MPDNLCVSGGNAKGRRRDATIARRDENLGFKNGLKVLSICSRIYLSGESGEFRRFCSESWVLSVIMVLSCGSSTVAGIRVLVEVVLWMYLSRWSFPNQCHVHRLEGCVRGTRLCGWKLVELTIPHT